MGGRRLNPSPPTPRKTALVNEEFRSPPRVHTRATRTQAPTQPITPHDATSRTHTQRAHVRCSYLAPFCTLYLTRSRTRVYIAVLVSPPRRLTEKPRTLSLCSIYRMHALSPPPPSRSVPHFSMRVCTALPHSSFLSLGHFHPPARQLLPLVYSFR